MLHFRMVESRWLVVVPSVDWLGRLSELGQRDTLVVRDSFVGSTVPVWSQAADGYQKVAIGPLAALDGSDRLYHILVDCVGCGASGFEHRYENGEVLCPACFAAGIESRLEAGLESLKQSFEHLMKHH